MSNYFGKFVSLQFAINLILPIGIFVIAALRLCGSTQSFNVPDDAALRIRARGSASTGWLYLMGVARKSIERTMIGAGAGALLGGSLSGAKVRASVP